MSTEDRDRAEAACRALATRLSMLIDLGRYEEALELYTDDGSHASSLQRVEGRAALAASFAARPASRLTRHMIVGTLVDVTGPDEARGVSNVVVYRLDAGEGRRPALPLPMPLAETIGEYHDQYRRENGRWKVASRRMVEIFDSRPAVLDTAGPASG